MTDVKDKQNRTEELKKGCGGRMKRLYRGELPYCRSDRLCKHCKAELKGREQMLKEVEDLAHIYFDKSVYVFVEKLKAELTNLSQQNTKTDKLTERLSGVKVADCIQKTKEKIEK